MKKNNKRYVTPGGDWLDGELYDKIGYDKKQPLSNYIFSIWQKQFIKDIKKYSKDKVTLDLGCGTGEYLIHALNTKELYGLDKSENFLKVCKEKLKNYNIKYICSPIENNNLPKNHFDFIFSTGVLMYLNHDTYFKEVHHLLKKGGTFIFINANLWNPYIFTQRIYRNLILKEFYQNEPNYFEIKKLLKKYDFKIIKYGCVGQVFHVPKKIMKFFIPVYKFLDIVLKPFENIFPTGKAFVFELKKK